MILYEDVAKNKKYWETLTEDQLEDYTETVFQYYRENGYPHYQYDQDEKQNEFSKLRNYDHSKIIEDGIVKQTMHGLGLAWSYFPHHITVQSGRARTPEEIFNDDDLFKRAIKKRIKHGNNISDAMIRKACRKYGGVGVSNFRPTAAAAIFDRYGGGTVYDMSAGFGGRLLGAYMSNKVTKYIGTDPSLKTHKGLMDLSVDIQKYPMGKSMDIEIILGGSEHVIPTKRGEIDMCFTSPPYFDTEKYSDEETQSYLKFPIYNRWLYEYLNPSIHNACYGLKVGGIFAINIADVHSAKSLVDDARELLEKTTTLEFVEELSLRLSGRPNTGYKYEPVLVYKKIK